MSDDDRPLTPAPKPRPGRQSAIQADIDYVRERQMEPYRVRLHESGQYRIRKVDMGDLAVEWRPGEGDEWTVFPDRFKSVGGALDFLRTKGVLPL